MADNVAAVIDDVLLKIGLDVTTPVMISRANVLTQVNHCLRDLTENTACFVKKDSTTLSLVTSTRSYSLPTDLYDIIRIYNTVDDTQVYPVTVEMLDASSQDWSEDSGSVYYFFRGFEGMDKVSFYKIPSSSYNGYVFDLWYSYYTTDLSDSSTSYLPSPVHQARNMFIDFCLHKLLRMHHEFRDLGEAEKHFGSYLAARQRWGTLERASYRTFVYGSRKGRVVGPLGPQWPSEYPDMRW